LGKRFFIGRVENVLAAAKEAEVEGEINGGFEEQTFVLKVEDERERSSKVFDGKEGSGKRKSGEEGRRDGGSDSHGIRRRIADGDFFRRFNIPKIIDGNGEGEGTVIWKKEGFSGLIRGLVGMGGKKEKVLGV